MSQDDLEKIEFEMDDYACIDALIWTLMCVSKKKKKIFTTQWHAYKDQISGR
jgi:hypothetical protein